MKILRFLLYIVLLSPLISQAEEHWYNYGHLYLQGGTYTHYSASDNHDGPKVLISLEAIKDNDWSL